MSDSVANGKDASAPQQELPNPPNHDGEHANVDRVSTQDHMKEMTSVYSYYDDKEVLLTPDTMRRIRKELRSLKASFLLWKKNRRARMENGVTEPCPFVLIDRNYQLPPKSMHTFYVSYHNSNRLNSAIHRLTEEKRRRQMEKEASGVEGRRDHS